MSIAGPSDQPPAPGADEAPPSADLSGLGVQDQRILAFERQWWKFEGSKEQAVREEFGFSPTRYYQLLNGLIDRPEALAHDPMLVKRLRKRREERRRQRTARRLGIRL